MSGTDEHPLLRGSRRVLMVSTVVMAAAAAAVLVLGTPDARLLRLGLVAALWAALLGAFATARLRGEISSCAEQADQLRTAYQRELEREVAARREHTLTVEREFRAQAELSQRREIVELRTELEAMRANLEQLLGGNSLLERPTSRAESACLLPLPAHPRKFDDSRSRAAVAATVEATAEAAPSLTGTELHFGPGRPAANWGEAPSPADGGITNGPGRHGVPGRKWSGSNGNGSPNSGSPNNGGGTWWTPAEMPPAASSEAQRTVNDLLTAYGRGAAPRRRRSHEDGPATSGEGVSRSS
ncbi:MAG TPA: DUF6779 domain-containing protein [Pseudonocardiaceae bacterium]|jgi:hypothetical protein|nr:DUF6779 domain-containing protein [Pseudonocardiaceae bacterium]